MFTKTALSTAIAASLLTTSNLPAEECPAPSFDELSASLHQAMCKIDTKSLERDTALLVEHQKLVKAVEAIDPDSAAQTIADIREFIASVDKDNDGAIDGLAGIVAAVNNLTPRITDLERRANLVDESIVDVRRQIQSNTEATNLNRQEIEALKTREDKVGITEERAYEIAGEMVCKTVLTPLKAAVDKFNTEVQAIDCNTEGHSDFMAAIQNGTDTTPPDGGDSGTTSGGAGAL